MADYSRHRFTAHAAAPRPKARLNEAFASRFADTLGISERAVRAVLGHVGGNLVILEHLRLSELEALRGLGRDEAEKIFSFVQRERARAYEGAFTSSRDRREDSLPAVAFSRLYREHLSKSQGALGWRRPQLEPDTRSPLRRLLNWLGC